MCEVKQVGASLQRDTCKTLLVSNNFSSSKEGLKSRYKLLFDRDVD